MKVRPKARDRKVVAERLDLPAAETRAAASRRDLLLVDAREGFMREQRNESFDQRTILPTLQPDDIPHYYWKSRRRRAFFPGFER